MIRVVLAEDHHLVRQGLRAVLDKAEEITVVGEAADGQVEVGTQLYRSQNERHGSPHWNKRETTLKRALLRLRRRGKRSIRKPTR